MTTRTSRPVLQGWLKTALCLSLACSMLTACTPRQENAGTDTSAAGEPAGWRVIGPGGGGGMFLPTISPHDPAIAMMHCDMTGAYITRDSGDNWEMINFWTVPEDFEFDPVEPEVIYAANRGYLHSEDRGSGLSCLFRSADNGRTWRIIYPKVEQAVVHERLQPLNLLPSQVVPGAFDGTITDIEVDPADNSRIYLGLAPMISYMGGGGEPTMPSALVIHTTDGGETWKKLAEVPGRSVLGIFPGAVYGAEGEVTVFTESACARIDAAGNLEQLPLPVERISAAEEGSGPDGAIVYVLSGMEGEAGDIRGGVFRSIDMGAHWEQVNSGLLHGVPEGELPSIRGTGIGVCEGTPGTVYLSLRNARTAREIEGSWLYGIFKTTDSGDSWQPVWLANGDGYITGNHESSWLDRGYGPGWGGNPIDLGVAPGDPDFCIGTDAGRSYRTTDGGAHWSQIHSHNLPDGSVSTSGLNVTTCYGVHFDPFDSRHIFISYTDVGLFHSYDGGESWYHSIEGVPRPWVNTCYWMTLDPDVEGRAWSVWGNAHDLPRDKMFSPRGFGRYQGGAAVSRDGGRTWKRAGTGIPDNSVCTHVALDPESPPESRTLYVCAFARGVYKSTDGGETWSEANRGLGGNRYAWQVRINSEGELYVVLARGREYSRGEGRMSQITVPGELYVSHDEAGSWQPVALPEGIDAPHDLQIDPENPDIMYLSCWARSEGGRDVNGGLFRTTDRGATWEHVFDRVMRVNSAALDPGNPATVFINTFENSAWRSDDRGDTWTRLEGYRFKWGQRPIPDVNNPGMLFLTTYGGSVHYGPAAGVPGAEKILVNMPESWW